MGSLSSIIQSMNFTISLPSSARTAFSRNNASMGGGGAVFWEDMPPNNIEKYRDDDKNVALYGGYAATPARKLSATRASYNATSGASMLADPITIQVTDG